MLHAFLARSKILSKTFINKKSSAKAVFPLSVGLTHYSSIYYFVIIWFFGQLLFFYLYFNILSQIFYIRIVSLSDGDVEFQILYVSYCSVIFKRIDPSTIYLLLVSNCYYLWKIILLILRIQSQNLKNRFIIWEFAPENSLHLSKQYCPFLVKVNSIWVLCYVISTSRNPIGSWTIDDIDFDSIGVCNPSRLFHQGK